MERGLEYKQLLYQFISNQNWQDDQDDVMKKFTPLPDERMDAGAGGGKWKIEQYSGRPETAKCKK